MANLYQILLICLSVNSALTMVFNWFGLRKIPDMPLIQYTIVYTEELPNFMYAINPSIEEEVLSQFAYAFKSELYKTHDEDYMREVKFREYIGFARGAFDRIMTYDAFRWGKHSGRDLVAKHLQKCLDEKTIIRSTKGILVNTSFREMLRNCFRVSFEDEYDDFLDADY